MKRKIELYLTDILESMKLIEDSIKNMTKKEFEKNRDIQDATIRRIEIIGEAVRHLSLTYRKKYPKIEWKQIIGMRNILTHTYFGVNIDKVWIAIKEDFPNLKIQIQEILEAEKEK